MKGQWWSDVVCQSVAKLLFLRIYPSLDLVGFLSRDVGGVSVEELFF